MSRHQQSRKIEFLITDLDPGGAERALLRIGGGLATLGWDVSVCSLMPAGELASEFRRLSIPVKSVGMKSFRSILHCRRLVRHLREIRPDILQTFLFHANVLGRLSGQIAGVPVICSGIRVAERRSKARLWLDRLTDRMVDCHICVSETVRDFSHRVGRLPGDKLQVIGNGVDAALFNHVKKAELSEFGIPADARVLLFVGRLDPQKNPDLLVEMMRKLASANPAVHLLLVGDGIMRGSLQQSVIQSGLRKQVHFAGQQKNVAGLMKAADILILPSRWEGLPNVILEAMATGLPVIASDVDGSGELIKSGQTGELFHVGDLDGLLAAVQRSLDEPQRAALMAAAAQNDVIRARTWDAVIAQYDRLYRSILATQ